MRSESDVCYGPASRRSETLLVHCLCELRMCMEVVIASACAADTDDECVALNSVAVELLKCHGYLFAALKQKQ